METAVQIKDYLFNDSPENIVKISTLSALVFVGIISSVSYQLYDNLSANIVKKTVISSLETKQDRVSKILDNLRLKERIRPVGLAKYSVFELSKEGNVDGTVL
ncbi:hypothetical protein COB57_02460 [Candidatus Peregrinibacteria bacterium]|nr:MAG: hypothetical protein COB57_02460 [Candidatus Peregrinibacteria bacterium]